MKQKHKNTRRRMQRVMNELMLEGLPQEEAAAKAMMAGNIPQAHLIALRDSYLAKGRFK